MMDRRELDHLAGIVALWLTNGNEPVEGGNDTRYDFFSGGYIDAVKASEELVDGGYLEFVGDCDTTYIQPTAKGIFAVIR